MNCDPRVDLFILSARARISSLNREKRESRYAYTANTGVAADFDDHFDYIWCRKTT